MTLPLASSDTPRLIPVPKWVISDTHLGHANILTYCPWRQTWARSIKEHDDAIIAAWEALVRPDDWVLHLGDFSLGAKEHLHQSRRRLPGKIILVRGNHDRSMACMRAVGFEEVLSAVRIEKEGRHWICRHNPAAFSLREASGAEQLLHGHTHGNGYARTLHPAVRSKAKDCSLDAMHSIAPVSWESVE